MAQKNITLTGDQIEDALQKVHGADSTPTAASENMVTSGAVKAALDALNTPLQALQDRVGWAFYQDSAYTAGSPLTSNNARTQITIDGLGSTTVKDDLPTGITDFWSSDKIVPGGVGDAYDIRIDFDAVPQTSSDFAEVQVDIGTGTPINIVSRTITFAKTGATRISLGFPLFVGATFLANGGKVYLDTSVSGDSIDIYNASIFIKRDYSRISV